MQTKENIAIDSCVFFHMVYFDKKYNEMDPKQFDNYVESKTLKNENQKNYLLNYLTKEYKEKNLNLSEHKLLENYKRYLKIERTKLEQLNLKLNNILNNKPNLSQEQISQLKNEITKSEKLLENINKRYNNYSKQYRQYKDGFDKLQILHLYKKLVNKEVNFFIPKTSYQEIQRHIARKGRFNYSMSISEKEAFSLLKKCNLINFCSKDSISKMVDIAKEFRTYNPDLEKIGKPMYSDLNSLGIYGDSQIMAESNIAGMILVTENAKDFITLGPKNSDDSKRRYIKYICEQNEPYTTDAFAYTPFEYLSGNYKQPTKSSSLPKKFKDISNLKVSQEVIL